MHTSGYKKTAKISIFTIIFICFIALLYQTFLYYSDEENLYNLIIKKGFIIENFTALKESEDNIVDYTYRSYIKLHFKVVNEANIKKRLERIKIVIRDSNRQGIGYFRMNPNIELFAQNSYKVVTSIRVSGNPTSILIVLYDENGNIYQQEIEYRAQ